MGSPIHVHKKQIMVSYLYFFSCPRELSMIQMVNSTSHLEEWRISDARAFVPVVNRIMLQNAMF